MHHNLKISFYLLYHFVINYVSKNVKVKNKNIIVVIESCIKNIQQL